MNRGEMSSSIWELESSARRRGPPYSVRSQLSLEMNPRRPPLRSRASEW